MIFISINYIYTNHFYSAIPTTSSEKKRGKRRIVVYGSVTRYGPRTSCQRKGTIEPGRVKVNS